jgi:hypothetical protein
MRWHGSLLQARLYACMQACAALGCGLPGAAFSQKEVEDGIRQIDGSGDGKLDLAGFDTPPRVVAPAQGPSSAGASTQVHLVCVHGILLRV